MLTPDQFKAIDTHLRKENWLHNEELIAELTDHYAAGIDERMARGSSFADALRTIHTEFGGRKELLRMEEEAQKQRTKKYYRQEWQLIRSFIQGPRWFVSVGLLMTVFLLNVVLNQHGQFKLIYKFGAGFVGSAVVGHILTMLVIAFRHRRDSSTPQSTSSPVFICIYVLATALLLMDQCILPAYSITLSPDLVIVLVTIIETLCTVYLSACLVLVWRQIRDERNRQKLRTT